MIEQVFLGVFALGAIAGAVAMLFLRHPMRVALALIGTMVSLAAIYAQLGLHVLAIFQVLVYVGAVMVFMVYAIMLLDTRDRSFTERFSPLLVAGIAGLALLGLLLVAGLMRGEVAGSGAMAAAVTGAGAGAGAAVADTDPFTVAQFARHFMDGYWLYFALAAVLLLVAEIAASAVLEIRRRVVTQAGDTAGAARPDATPGPEAGHG